MESSESQHNSSIQEITIFLFHYGLLVHCLHLANHPHLICSFIDNGTCMLPGTLAPSQQKSHVLGLNMMNNSHVVCQFLASRDRERQLTL